LTLVAALALVTALTGLVTALPGLIALTMVAALTLLITFLLLITFCLGIAFFSLMWLMGGVFYFFVTTAAFNVFFEIAVSFANSWPFGLFQIVVHCKKLV
jgi:hypothetical protein